MYTCRYLLYTLAAQYSKERLLQCLCVPSWLIFLKLTTWHSEQTRRALYKYTDFFDFIILYKRMVKQARYLHSSFKIPRALYWRVT